MVIQDDFLIYVNDKPRITSQPESLRLLAGHMFAYRIQVEDRNSDARIDYRLESGPEGMSLDSDGILNWRTNETHHDDYQVVISASDGFDRDVQTFTLNVNARLTITSAVPHVANIQKPYSYQVTVFQPGSRKDHVFSLLQAPEGMSIAPNGLISWTPTPAQIDTQFFQMRITDGVAEDVQDGWIYVNDKPRIISQPESLRLLAGHLFAYRIQVEDRNSDARIDYRLESGPEGMSLDSDGILNWRTNETHHDDYQVVLSVSDGFDKDVQTFPLNIKPRPSDKTPPVIQIYEPTITRGMKKITQADKTVQVKGRATDDSGIFEVLVNGLDASIDENGYFWVDVMLALGINRIIVRSSDVHGNTAEFIFTVIRETEARQPPQVAEKTVDFHFGEYHALLIAIQDYSDGSIHDLDYPISDGAALRRVLLEKYTFSEDNIHILNNPDRQAILGKFGELRRSLEPNDNLLVFYAGHGYWDEDLRQGYWLPRDARQSDQAAWISNSDIRDQIRGLKTQHTLLISDACFSGGIFRTREAFLQPEMAVQKVYKLPSRKALTSGNLKTVPDRSVFVEFLVKRLEQNTEPYLYSEKLYINMKDAVINNSPNNQTPLFGVVNGAGDEGGDFIFVRKR